MQDSARFTKAYSTNDFIVYFDQPEEKQIKILVGNLQEKLNELLSFFELEQLKNPTEIYIYSDKNEYINHMLKHTDAYRDWMIGDTSDGIIHMLSVENCRLAQAHQNMTFDQWIRVVVHELVHICQQEVNSNITGCEWFWEALALNLSGQTLPETIIDCTKKQLMFDYLNLPNGYPISFTLGKFMLKNFSHERLLGYITNSQQLWDDTETIINNCNQFEKEI